MNLAEPIDLSGLSLIAPIPAQRVAATVARIADPEKRRIIWYLHWVSHQEGGLAAFAKEMLDLVIPHRLGTPTMRAAGVGTGIVYSGETYELICGEIKHHDHRTRPDLLEELDCLAGSLSLRAPTGWRR
jgi:hypothetical protein